MKFEDVMSIKSDIQQEAWIKEDLLLLVEEVLRLQQTLRYLQANARYIGVDGVAAECNIALT